MTAAQAQEKTTTPAAEPPRRAPVSLIVRMAVRYGVDAEKLMKTLRDTAFRQRPDKQTGEVREPTNEEMMALLIIADQYGLNPFTREIYAFFDSKSKAIVPVVSVDGWARIINEHEQFDGMEFVDGEAFPLDKHKGAPLYIDCIMYRKDRNHATTIRERMTECFRPNVSPWESHPARMLRHKAMIQCARMAFGFAGISDPDEAERILEAEAQRVADATANAAADLNAGVKGITHQQAQGVTTIIDAQAERVADEAQATATKRKLHAGEQPKENGPTFAYVADALNNAKTVDEFAASHDLIRSVPDGQQREELEALAAAAAIRIPGVLTKD